MKENRFNLIDEPWIPVAGKGKVGLKEIFSDTTLTALGGNPVEKISVFKLLLAIAQSAFTPKDETEWESVGCDGMQKKILTYLKQNYDCFWLYGEKPFLQMPEIEKAAKKLPDEKKQCDVKIGSGAFPDLMADNNTFVSQYDFSDISESDSMKALFLLSVINFSFYGKQVNNNIVLSSTIKKGQIAKPGPSLGFNNYLHSYGFIGNILNSVYYNLTTQEKINEIKVLGNEIGIPFWQKMPTSEDDEIAKRSKQTLIGHLLPLSRFVFLTDKGIYFTEGIQYQFSNADKKKGIADADWIESSFSWQIKDGNIKALYADVNKKPWRNLVSLIVKRDIEKEYNNLGLEIFFNRISTKNVNFNLWSGGIDVSGDAFGKKIKGSDDFIESEVQLSSEIFSSTSKFLTNLENEMGKLKDRADVYLNNSVYGYYKTLSIKPDNFITLAKQDFWQLCESSFQQLVEACECPDGEDITNRLEPFTKKFNSYVLQIYNQYCPNQTARQLEAWAKNKPFTKHVLHEVEKDTRKQMTFNF